LYLLSPAPLSIAISKKRVQGQLESIQSKGEVVLKLSLVITIVKKNSIKNTTM
jgi:hypothetical protein